MNALQFGFKCGHSTSLCTATVKNVVSHYMHNCSVVLGCFLDASIYKVFELVDHGIFFRNFLIVDYHYQLQISCSPGRVG